MDINFPGEKLLIKVIDTLAKGMGLRDASGQVYPQILDSFYLKSISY